MSLQPTHSSPAPNFSNNLGPAMFQGDAAKPKQEPTAPSNDAANPRKTLRSASQFKVQKVIQLPQTRLPTRDSGEDDDSCGKPNVKSKRKLSTSAQVHSNESSSSGDNNKFNGSKHLPCWTRVNNDGKASDLMKLGPCDNRRRLAKVSLYARPLERIPYSIEPDVSKHFLKKDQYQSLRDSLPSLHALKHWGVKVVFEDNGATYSFDLSVRDDNNPAEQSSSDKVNKAIYGDSVVWVRNDSPKVDTNSVEPIMKLYISPDELIELAQSVTERQPAHYNFVLANCQTWATEFRKELIDRFGKDKSQEVTQPRDTPGDGGLETSSAGEWMPLKTLLCFVLKLGLVLYEVSRFLPKFVICFFIVALAIYVSLHMF